MPLRLLAAALPAVLINLFLVALMAPLLDGGSATAPQPGANSQVTLVSAPAQAPAKASNDQVQLPSMPPSVAPVPGLPEPAPVLSAPVPVNPVQAPPVTPAVVAAVSLADIALPDISSAVSTPAATPKTVQASTRGKLVAADAMSPQLAPQPSYPEFARRIGVEGKVRVVFLVTADGRVEQPRIVKSSPPDTFDDVVLDAIQKWRFEPLGTESPTRAYQDFSFALADS